MRILVVFIDMVRVDQLNLINPHSKETALDIHLKKLGGTLFTRCFTPGPDTPRSNACMQTGLYPYFNGCDTRIKWPKYFIKDNISTIFDHAFSQDYTINACVRKHTIETGLLRYKGDTLINYFEGYKDFVENAEINKNTLSFLYDPDWHTAISDLHSTQRAFREGDRVVSFLFEKYIDGNYIDKYDYTIIYSDHGFQFQSESNRMKSKLELLNNGRNQVLLFIHKKGDEKIMVDNRLSSMLDLYATLEDLLGCSDFRQGYSLLDKPQRKILHIEDHQDFKVYPEVMVKQWRVITNRYDVCTDGKRYTCDKDSDTYKEIDTYLREYSPKYSEYVKQLEVWDHYAELSNDISPYYVVGEKRVGKCKVLIYKILQNLKARMDKLIGKYLQ
jgi:arylsulfatase A-like enzyme